MVRNAASWNPSLRDSISDVSISSQPAQQFVPERLDRVAMQLRPHDAYTRRLMSRVATGQATADEEAVFDERVARMQGATKPAAGLQHREALSGEATVPSANRSTLDQERMLSDRTKEPQRRRRGSERASDASCADAQRFPQATRENAKKYAEPFCKFLTENPTVFHAVAALKEQMLSKGWKELSERDEWKIEPEGRYFVERNGSALISFVVGANYKSGKHFCRL